MAGVESSRNRSNRVGSVHRDPCPRVVITYFKTCQNRRFCRAPTKSISGFIIRTYKK